MSVERVDKTPQPDIDREALQALSGPLLRTWDKLQPEYRVAIAPVLIDTVMGGEFGPWLQGVMERNWSVEAEPSEQKETIFNITRDHLKRARFSEQEIAKFSERDLLGMAQTLEFIYTRGDVLWEDLRSIASETLEELEFASQAEAHPPAGTVKEPSEEEILAARMRKAGAIYFITRANVREAAEHIVGRELPDDELDYVLEKFGEDIGWMDWTEYVGEATRALQEDE